MIYMSRSLHFRAPVRDGDTVRAIVTVTEVMVEKGRPVAHTVQGLRMRRGGGEALVAIRRPEDSVT